MPIIAISRGTFSGGEALAKGVAERLKYRCLSREMNLEAVAREYGIWPKGLTAAMEKRPSLLERVGAEHTAYLACVRAALCEQARGDKLIYHGYLGHLLLPGIAHVIGVRVIADLEFRAQAVQRQQHLAREDARAYIERVDKERQEWTRFLFGVDWEDSHLYHLVLNLSQMTLDVACETVAHLAKRPEYQPTAASLKALEDLALSSRVSAALARDFRTRDADLKVTAADGIVTVAGTTRWQEVVDAVPVVLRRVPGVRKLRSEIAEPAHIHPLNFY